MAEGLTTISRRANEGIFQEMTAYPAADFPDDLTKSKKTLKFMPVDEKLQLSDETMTLDVLWTRQNIHMADAVFAYAPAQKLIIEEGYRTVADDYPFWRDDLSDLIDHYKLDVENLSPFHSVLPNHPRALTIQEVDELVRKRTQRARERCASELKKGNYFPGRSVWSKRY